jgi:hypothetical protein
MGCWTCDFELFPGEVQSPQEAAEEMGERVDPAQQS